MIPVFDGHNDTVLKHLEDPSRDFFERQADGHIDHVRAQEGGMFGGFFAVYTPGSSAGLPVSVLRSFDAPQGELIEDADAFRERIQSSLTVCSATARCTRWVIDAAATSPIWIVV